MRGVKHDIPDETYIKLYEEKGVKGTADELGLSMTTVTSRLQTLGVYKRRKVLIKLNKRNIKFINTHTLIECCSHFNVSISYIRNFVNRHNIAYIRCRTLAPTEVARFEKRKVLRDAVVKMHETMTYKEIGIVLNISIARVCQIIRYGH